MERKIIVAHGLGDGNRLAEKLYQTWWRNRHGQPLEFYQIPWEDKEKFSDKLDRLLERIDEAAKQGNRISLIGISASGSAVLNAFCARESLVNKVVNVCGRLQEGTNSWLPLSRYQQSHPAFVESVLMFEEREKTLGYDDRNRVLTVRPLADEIVPDSTMILDGAVNTRIISVGHAMSIATAMTLYSRNIYNFIDDQI